MSIKYLRLLSDLHMEGTNFKLPPLDTDPETVLILAGDINVGVRALGLLQDVYYRFHHVIYVCGNHEYYRQNIVNVRDFLRGELEYLEITNVSVFDQPEIMDLDGVRFACGTLWTDMNKNDPLTHLAVRDGLYDFQLIRNGDKTFTTQDAYAIFQKTVEKFASWVDETTIVVTHHMPSEWCVHPRFKDSYHLNGGFRSDLDAFITRHQPRYWFHGHGHDSVNVQLGNTKIISNPRGYPRRLNNEIPVFENPMFNPTMLIEL